MHSSQATTNQGAAVADESTPPAAPQKPKSGVAGVGESAVKAVVEAVASGAAQKKLDQFKPFVNLGAAALLFYGFYLFQSDSIQRGREDRQFAQEQAREDRKMFKDSLTVMHEDSTRKWAAINDNQRALIETTRAVQALQTTTAEMTRAVHALQTTTNEVGEAVKDMRNDLRRTTPPKARQPVPAKEPESRGGELLPVMPREVGG